MTEDKGPQGKQPEPPDDIPQELIALAEALQAKLDEIKRRAATIDRLRRT